jgi:UDP-N-acetylglucosamine 2-epimerase (non-hydrolysing)
MLYSTVMKIQVILGTRPEIIKLYPFIAALKSGVFPNISLHVTVTGQHRQLLDQFLHMTGLRPDVDLKIMRPNQSLDITTSKAFARLHSVISDFNPDWIMVQGDTLSAFTGAMIGFHHRIPVAHVEAGLRSHKLHSPWPEEGYRQMIARIANMHFAPTERAKAHLIQEGIAEEMIVVTGNTVVESSYLFARNLADNATLSEELAHAFSFLNPNKKMLLVTTHRRENMGDGIASICSALKQLSTRDDVQIVLPIHQNPRVWHPIREALGAQQHIYLLPPQEYMPFLYLMQRAHIILTDSGGVQEEAPSLGKPVLVLRDTTERHEGIEAGVAKLVGTDATDIVRETALLLDNDTAYASMVGATNPYGDGTATQRILMHLCGHYIIPDSVTPPAHAYA